MPRSVSEPEAHGVMEASFLPDSHACTPDSVFVGSSNRGTFFVSSLGFLRANTGYPWPTKPEHVCICVSAHCRTYLCMPDYQCVC